MISPLSIEKIGNHLIVAQYFVKNQTFCVCFDFAENKLGMALNCFSFLDKNNSQEQLILRL